MKFLGHIGKHYLIWVSILKKLSSFYLDSLIERDSLKKFFMKYSYIKTTAERTHINELQYSSIKYYEKMNSKYFLFLQDA